MKFIRDRASVFASILRKSRHNETTEQHLRQLSLVSQTKSGFLDQAGYWKRERTGSKIPSKTERLRSFTSKCRYKSVEISRSLRFGLPCGGYLRAPIK